MRSGTRNRAATVRERFSAEDTTPLPYGRGSDKTSHTPSEQSGTLLYPLEGRSGPGAADVADVLMC